MPKWNPEWPRLDPAVLARTREGKGMTQVALSRAVGMSEGYIGRVERGHYLPPYERVRQIAEVLGVAVEDLLTRTGQG